MASKSVKFYTNLIITFGPLFALVAVGFWVAAQFIAPAVPKKITITTGGEKGAYYQIAQKYREELVKEGITVEILSSSGSLDNIDRLLKGEADVGFVQGGTVNPDAELDVLASLYNEPVWIFLNNKISDNQLNDFSKLRISIGTDGSGTQSIAKILLEMNDVHPDPASLLSMPNSEAADSLLENKIDVAFFVTSANAPLVQKLLRDNRVHLLNFERADAYSHLLPYLSKIILAEGVIDLHLNIPAKDINMIAPTANLIVRQDLHSALQVLLLEAASKIHSGPDLFSDPGEFPSDFKTALPVSEIAERYYKVGPPFLMRYLPFRVAIFIDRMVVLLIPLLALVIPLMKVMPPLYRWRVRSSIYRWYKELQDVENETFIHQLTAEQLQALIKELERIEAEVNKVKTPLSYADQLYNLLLHIDLVKKKLKTSMQAHQDTA